MNHGPGKKCRTAIGGNELEKYYGGGMIICTRCKGNGYIKVKFEAEESIDQCKVCHSSGKLDEKKHYRQSWDEESYNGIIAQTIYYGPPLDPESFHNYKIHGE